MARPRSEKIQTVEAELRQRLRHGNTIPGERFMSNRALAERFDISLQSAHDILKRLCREGLLERRAASGTYIPQSAGKQLQGVLLVFNPRARRKESFGYYLHSLIRSRLEAEAIPFETTHRRRISAAALDPTRFPVFWEVDEDGLQDWPAHRFGLILHREPPLGMASTWLDSISIDDQSGGVMAAQFIQSHIRPGGRVTVVAGPADDRRSRMRIAGFQKVFPGARILFACGWYRRHGLEIAPEVLHSQPEAIFCCNDRLAEGILNAAQNPGTLPLLLGFDNAPVAGELNLNTIAIPWEEVVETALATIVTRLAGAAHPSSRRILTPRPVIRTERPG